MISVPFIVAGFALACLTQLVKNIIFPKYGATGVHVFIFIIATLGTVVVGMVTAMPSLMAIIENGLALLATAITMYETVLSKIGFSGAQTTV